jgi:hypothetical protein
MKAAFFSGKQSDETAVCTIHPYFLIHDKDSVHELQLRFG